MHSILQQKCNLYIFTYHHCIFFSLSTRKPRTRSIGPLTVLVILQHSKIYCKILLNWLYGCWLNQCGKHLQCTFAKKEGKKLTYACCINSSTGAWAVGNGSAGGADGCVASASRSAALTDLIKFINSGIKVPTPPSTNMILKVCAVYSAWFAPSGITWSHNHCTSKTKTQNK